MTCDSIASRPMRARRPSSRSTSLRDLLRQRRGRRASRAARRRSPASSPSPSSFWIALSCSRRNISRWRSPSSSWTLDLMSSWASSTTSWRWTWTSTRRRRSSTDRVSSSICCCGLVEVGVAGHQVGQAARRRRPPPAPAGRPPRAGRTCVPSSAARSRASRNRATKAGSCGVERLHLVGLADHRLEVGRRRSAIRMAMPRCSPWSSSCMPPRPRWTWPIWATVPMV